MSRSWFSLNKNDEIGVVMKIFPPLFLRVVLLLSLGASAITQAEPQKPYPEIENKAIEIKVVVITMFEIGEDEGDQAGEFQLWKQNQQLTQRFEFPAGFHDLYINPKTGVLGMVTGMGNAKSAAAIMALGLDPRFDLSHAYWLVAGIAGIDPHDGTIGDAVWAKYLVDGDLAHEIDSREIPKHWPTGYFPLFANQPVNLIPDSVDPSKNHHAPNGEMFQLNGKLSQWAFELTKTTKLADTAGMKKLRSSYSKYPKALTQPKVMQGEQLASSTFWHGELMNNWANDWVKYWTKGQGNFVTSAMEDTGTYQALSYLNNAKLARTDRLLVLRTASNFTMQPPHLSAAENLQKESEGSGYVGLPSAIQNANSVGGKVVNTIVTNWAKFKNETPE